MPTMSELDELEGLGWDTYHDHVPAPSEHAPRKEARPVSGRLYVAEVGNAETWITAENPVEVRQ